MIKSAESLKKALICCVVFFNLFHMATSSYFLSASEPNLTLWCEYPTYGTGYDMKGYFSILLDFIRKKNIKRTLFRVMDPPAFPIYMIGKIEDKDHGLLVSFLSNDKFKASGCEVYFIPWINQKDSWGYPLTPASQKLPSAVSEEEWERLNSIRKSVLYTQLLNEYMNQIEKSDFRITGIVYEEEGAGIWSGKQGVKKAFIEFNSALKEYIRPPSPPYSNSSASNFRFASASQYNFDDHESGTYLNEIFPQMYNLTAGSSPIMVDAVADSSIIHGNNYKPRFPSTIYTQYYETPEKLADEFKKFTAPYPDSQRRKDICYMFSAERAPVKLFGIKNNFNIGDKTITGIDMAGNSYKGKINAFGSPQYTWSKFMLFLEAFGKLYKSDNFAIFQFNLIPSYWADTEREQTSDQL